MNILIEAPEGVVPPTVATGWCRALSASGFPVGVLKDHEHVFDVFHDFKPDVFVSTCEPTRAVAKCLAARPRLKVVDQREYEPAFDSVGYKEGSPNPALRCDLAFVAEWTEEKAPLYRHWLDPIIECDRYDVKLFGSGDACPYPQHLGWLDDRLLPDLYASAHLALDLSLDSVTERWYQIAGLGGKSASNIIGMTNYPLLTNGDLEAALNNEMRHWFRPSLDIRDAILSFDTYFYRMASAFSTAGLHDAAETIIKTGDQYAGRD